MIYEWGKTEKIQLFFLIYNGVAVNIVRVSMDPLSHI